MDGSRAKQRTRDALKALATIRPGGDDDLATWKRFDQALLRVDPDQLAAHEVGPIFAVFESCPQADNDWLWSALHFLEAVPGYERALFESLGRAPSVLAARMARRIFNSPDFAFDRVVLSRAIEAAAKQVTGGPLLDDVLDLVALNRRPGAPRSPRRS